MSSLMIQYPVKILESLIIPHNAAICMEYIYHIYLKS